MDATERKARLVLEKIDRNLAMVEDRAEEAGIGEKIARLRALRRRAMPRL